MCAAKVFFVVAIVLTLLIASLATNIEPGGWILPLVRW